MSVKTKVSKLMKHIADIKNLNVNFSHKYGKRSASLSTIYCDSLHKVNNYRIRIILRVKA